jgi:hypothetical protein
MAVLLGYFPQAASKREKVSSFSTLVSSPLLFRLFQPPVSPARLAAVSPGNLGGLFSAWNQLPK